MVTQFVSDGAIDLYQGSLSLEPALITTFTFHYSVFPLYSPPSSLWLGSWLSHGMP